MSTDNYLQEHLNAAITAAQETNPNLARNLAVTAGCHGLAAPSEEKELHEYHQKGVEIGKAVGGSDNPINNALSTEIASVKVTQKRSAQQLKEAQRLIEESQRLKKRSRFTLIGASVISLIGVAGLIIGAIYGSNMSTRANEEINKAQKQQAKMRQLTHENNRLNTVVNSLEKRGENLQQDLEALQESELAKEVEKWREDYQGLNQNFASVNQKLNKVCSRKRSRFFASECKGRR